MERRRRAAVAASVLVLAACSGCKGGGGASATTASTQPATSAGPSTDDAATVVRTYLQLLSAGDVDAANALRCRAGRVDDGSMDAFAAAVQRLVADAGGELVVGEVAAVEPITLADLSGARPMAQIAVTLSAEGGSTPGVALAVTQEDGTLRLCGEMQEGAPNVQQGISTAVFPPFIGRLDDLAGSIPTFDPAKATVADDRQLTDLSGVPGATDGWTRAWALADGTGLRVTAYRTSSAEETTQIARASLAAAGLDAVELFPSLHGGFVGVSVVTDAWTWAHPASLGTRNQVAAAVVGDIAMVVELGGVPASEGSGRLDAVLDTFGFGD